MDCYLAGHLRIWKEVFTEVRPLSTTVPSQCDYMMQRECTTVRAGEEECLERICTEWLLVEQGKNGHTPVGIFAYLQQQRMDSRIGTILSLKQMWRDKGTRG